MSRIKLFKLLTVLQYTISIGILIFGAIYCIICYINLKHHIDWSAAYYTPLVLFGVFVIGAFLVFIIFYFIKKFLCKRNNANNE